MVQKRDVAIYLILSMVTCGLFAIYWFIVLTDDVDAVTGQPGVGGGMSFLFALLSCGIYYFYWAYKTGEKLDQARMANGIPSANYAIVFLLLQFFGLSIVTFCIAQGEVNNFVPF